VGPVGLLAAPSEGAMSRGSRCRRRVPVWSGRSLDLFSWLLSEAALEFQGPRAAARGSQRYRPGPDDHSVEAGVASEPDSRRVPGWPCCCRGSV